MTPSSEAPSPAPTYGPSTAGWFVERSDRPEPHWWAIPFGWSPDPDQAMQFARGVDAQAFIEFFSLTGIAVATDRPTGAPGPTSPGEAPDTFAEREALERLRLIAEGAPGDSVYDPEVYLSPGKTFYADIRLIYDAVRGRSRLLAGERDEVPAALVNQVAQIILGPEPMDWHPGDGRLKALDKARAAIDAVRRALLSDPGTDGSGAAKKS